MVTPHPFIISRSTQDIFIYRPAEAPDDSKQTGEIWYDSGGGGINAARTFRSISSREHPVTLLSGIGAEDDGRDLLVKSAEQYGVDLIMRDMPRTRRSAVVLQGKQRNITQEDAPLVYLEKRPNITADDKSFLHLDGHMADAAVGYASLFHHIDRPIHYDFGSVRRGTTYSKDGGKVHDELLPLATSVILSEEVCKDTFAMTPEVCLSFLIKRYPNLKFIGATFGEKGCYWVSSENPTQIQHTPALNIDNASLLNTNGAGDAFQIAFAHAVYHLGLNYDEAVADATAVAAAKITHGTFPSPEQVADVEKRFSPVENALA